ncbi:MAG: hypothetical protein ACLGSD_05280 [Acidobacteriota bacterium]
MRIAASLLLALSICTVVSAQTLPRTAGETLTGQRLVVAQAAQGHPVILVAAFSHKAGERCSHWMQAIQKDPAFASTPTYQLIMLGSVPSLLRGTVKGMIRRGVPPAEQSRFVVLTQDEKQWRAYFQVSADDDPYVVLLDAAGKKLWSGDGSARQLERSLRAAVR